MLILIKKPSGITSHDAISAVKKSLRQPARDALSDEEKWAGMKPPKIKIWHAGTLDPMASWLIIAATDKDTKLLHSLTGQDKTYQTTIDFSRASDTWDLDYRKEIRDIDPTIYEEIPTLNQIEDILSSLIWTPNLPLTPFSAKKVDGKKLYEYAREWKPIFLTTPMTIYGYKILDYAFPLLTIQLHVGSGTYIRSIAHRLGTQIWWDALLTVLHRITIGEYSINDIKKPLIAQWDDKYVEYSILEKKL